MAFLVLLLLLNFVFNATNAQSTSSIIKPGSSLSPINNSYLLSPSGQFAFGFYPYKKGYSVGIWFENIQQKTIVWTANREASPFPSDVTLVLTTEGTLIVRPKQGQDVLIADTSSDDVSQLATSASILDSGNFVLLNSSGGIVWKSFDFPTDTILPGQRLAVTGKLVSSVAESDHGSGKFLILMQTDGNLVQYPVGAVELGAGYWATSTFNAGYGVSLNLDGNGHLYLLNDTGFNIKSINTNYVNASGKSMYRATIDTDGIFRLYSHSSDRFDDWYTEWSSSNYRCDPFGLCGENSYCVMIDGEPVCRCPPHFDFINKKRQELGCRKNYSLVACDTRNDQTFDFLEVNDVSWKDDAYLSLSSKTKNSCRDECYRDCSCEAAVFENELCKMMKLPLRFGRRVLSGQVTTFLKIGGELAGVGTRKRKRKLRMDMLIISITVACLTLGFLAVATIGVRKYRAYVRKYKRVLRLVNNRVAEDVSLKSFSFEELKDATNNFVEVIGKGAYGTVFKGVIFDGERTVAVKRLEKVVAEGESDFLNEMKAIGKTHHKNLVRLLGYCYDGTNRLLVYEYMENGSLADFLFKSRLKVNWEVRVEIVLSIARGICYLHEECETRIIHCDIKPENILMDDKGYAKIADFGLAKLLMPNQTGTYTEIRGTRGYFAPEWLRNLPITVKADVYSFGIMLFEIICCRRSVKADVPENEQVLAFWVNDCFKANEVEKLVQNEFVEKSKLEKMVKVGLWCTQDEASSRPSMKRVILMLEGTVNIPDPPLLSSFVSSPPRLSSFVTSP
ncbi:hypothetical protein V6Z11_D06G011400 [Gossypium hirsutum]|uniref:Receptor-like serine/threonine-protein kinase n=1 Tax=Gossypium hirsutum TaxID=3635 RepID=A0A1U8MQ96_GOSHI|nr:G-type lectin S-receptor-like serine/threonine-protein kinase LECRK3 [Gossypium hirsutum]